MSAAITTSRTSLLTSTNRRSIMKSNEEKAKRSARRTATTCDRSGTTSKTLRKYFAHNVTQRELNRICSADSLSTARTIHQVFPTEYAQHALSLFQGDFAIARHISTGKFVIHVDDEPKPSDTTNVTEEVKQAQREAKEDAERFVAEEERPDTHKMSEERSAGRSYIPSDIGMDIDDEDAGVCPDNPEEDADAIHLLQVKAICVDEAGEASYLSGFIIGVVLFKVWKVFANNEADVVKEPGEGGGLYCPYISINGRDDCIFNMSMNKPFQSRRPMKRSLPLLSSRM